MTIPFELLGTRAEQAQLPDLFSASSRSGGPASDVFLPSGYLVPRQSFDVGPVARGAAAAQQRHEAADKEVLVLELADGSTLVTSAARLRDALRISRPELVAADGTLRLEALRDAGTVSRGAFSDAVGGLVSKVFSFGVGDVADKIMNDAAGRFGLDVALLGVSWLGTKALMWAIEERLPRGPGLYAWDGGELSGSALTQLPSRIGEQPAAQPILVFLHGTGSHTLGSFGDLGKCGRNFWAALETNFPGGLYGFEHRTLSESPIENAIALLELLPVGAHVNLVTHSRGGLVGDLLCLGDISPLIDSYRHDLPGSGDASPEEASRVLAELADAHAEQRAGLRRLAELLATKRPLVQRYVRVASPAAGTRLASGNFDLFVSGLLSLIGRAPLLAATPYYAAFKRVVLEIAKNRTHPRLVPGIEAMLPDAPMARLLRSAPLRDGLSMSLIAGDIEGGGMLQRLGVLLVDHLLFDDGDNDLVVDTPAMLAGIAPQAAARVRFDRGADVSHFRYFENEETRSAMSDWLLADDVMRVDEFRALPGPADYASALEEASTRRDAGGPVRPVVVLLPGVMGSHIGVGSDAARLDRIWFDPVDILRGGLEKIAWGRSDVLADDVFGMFYGKLCAHLASGHRVERFAYDWRQPMDVLADRLATFLQTQLAASEQPIRLLAHSMGGLVVRACIARHRELMDRVMARPGARLLMMGTPNQGAYSMVANVIGKGDTLRTLVRLDMAHDMQQVLDIVAGFRGALQLLPKPGFSDIFQGQSDGGDSAWNFQQAGTWTALAPQVKDFWFGNGRVGRPTQEALNEASWLWQQDGLAPPALPASYRDNTIYVFGVAPNTPCGLRKVGDSVKLVGTTQGDGTVTWKSGRIDGIGSFYYLPAAHGDLLATESFFPAIAGLLETGRTTLLDTSPPALRDAVQPLPVTYDAGPPVTDEIDIAQRRLVGASPQRRLAGSARQRRRLEVQVRAKDLRSVNQPILVGHYDQDPIAGPQALIDRDLLDGDLGERHRMGLYPGPLGTAAAVLRVDRSQAGAPSVLSGAVITGLGPYERPLTQSRLTDAVRAGALRYLLQTLDVLGSDERELPLSALLIGYNSSANLNVGNSVEALVRGVMEGNRVFRENTGSNIRITRLEIVELYVDTAISAAYALRNMQQRLAADAAALGTLLVCGTELELRDSARHRLYDGGAGMYWPRLVVGLPEGTDEATPAEGVSRTRLPTRMRFTYIGQRARAEMVVQQRQPGLVEQIVHHQIASAVWNESLGRTLFQLMVPHDFKDAARQLDRVVLVVDSSSANLPWELMVADDPGRDGKPGKPLALRTRLVRQLASGSFRRGVRQSTGLHALVVGNPSVAGFAKAFPGTSEQPTLPLPNLPGAENEAKAVAAVLAGQRYEVRSVIGADQSASDVLVALYEQPWRIVHIAAHGGFDLQHADGRTRTGVLLSDGLLITAAEIEAMEVVPDLVVLNCCHLGTMESERLRDGNKLAASIARELIDIGVRCVLVAGWSVSDRGARLFGESFYAALLQDNASFGEAVFSAREALWNVAPGDITWGAFQAYGDPAWRASRQDEGRSRGGTPDRFVAPEELIAELAQLRSELSRRAGRQAAVDRKQDLAALSRLLERTPQGWLARADVRVALADTWRDLRELEKARAAYLQALQSEDLGGAVSIRAIEQLANIEARLATAGQPNPMLVSAIRRLEALERAIAPDESGARVAHSAERSSLLGSAYKRIAGLQADSLLAGSLAAAAATEAQHELRATLHRSQAHYGKAADASAANPYPMLNRLALLAVIDDVQAVGGRAAAIQSARECGSAARERFVTSADFWDAAMVPEALLVEHLLDGRLAQAGTAGEQTLTTLAAGYAAMRESVGASPLQLDSVSAHMRLLERFYRALALGRSTRAEASFTGAADRLDRLAALLGGVAPSSPVAPSGRRKRR